MISYDHDQVSSDLMTRLLELIVLSWKPDALARIDANAELRASHLVVCAMVGEFVAGFITVAPGTAASPDKDTSDIDALWIGDIVVAPKCRQRGIAAHLMDLSRRYCVVQGAQWVYLCTDNSYMKQRLFRDGWEYVRKTCAVGDDGAVIIGAEFEVFRYGLQAPAN